MEKTFTKYHFDGQRPDEMILLVLHRHWFDIVAQLIVVFVMLFFLFGSYFLPFFFYDELQDPLYRSLTSFLRNLFLTFIWITFFLIWVDYYFDIWIVTDRRIVNIEQKGLFSRVVSELELENIQDITTQVQGLIPTFLNYGNLYVQTAAEKERFIFRHIPDPYKVKDLVMNLQKKFEDREENQFGEMLKEKICHEKI